MQASEKNAFHFANEIAPLFRHNGNNYYRIQGIEKLVIGSRHLCYSSNTETSKTFGAKGLLLETKEWLGGGTFRNSLYLETLSQLTSVRDLSLSVDFEGALRLKLMCAVKGKPAETLADVQLISKTRTTYLHNIGSPTDLPESCRVFWHMDALEGDAVLHDASFCTTSSPKDTRMAVMLRTFGRTTDVKALLKRFAEAGESDAFYASILDNINFWVLDTTTGAESEYAEPWMDKLNVRVLVGPNLGGGGNAGHMLKLFDDACQASATPPTELLILDDDLSLSMESVARYFMFCAYRAQEVICSLPILMKSRPTTVWEDGGFWGRLNFHESGDFGRKRNLFPNLLKHGTRLDGYDRLDDFGALNTCEYSTFIFYGMSMKTFRKVAFPASFFLRGDDIELSLRAQELGITMITNPNLAAWHEPAHSYGQEYMAILHGIIINLTYSDQGVEFYTRYFQERFHEHASINDTVGMRLYLAILSELLNRSSRVLSADFQQHYLAKLKEFGSVKMLKIPDADRETFERNARDNKVLLVPFVYPGYHKDATKFKSIVVINHSAKAYRQLPACSPSDLAVIGKEYMNLLAQLADEFEAIRGLWQQRLKDASSDAYWTSIRDRYVSETKQISRYQRSAHQTSPITKAFVSEIGMSKEDRAWWRETKVAFREEQLADELRCVLRDETRAMLQTRRAFVEQPEATAKSSGADKQGDWKRKLFGVTVGHFGTGSSRKVRGQHSLPSDFDPAMYLQLNSDVAQAGVDPGEHYLKHGVREGRRYRA